MKSKILVVDDNEKNIRLMQLLLEHAGYAVVCAEGGLQAVELARQEYPDLIVMDIQMPDMDGMHAARKIFADELLRHIPVIGISAYASPSTREMALRLGMKGFFEKPIHREKFVAEINAFLPHPLQEIPPHHPRST